MKYKVRAIYVERENSAVVGVASVTLEDVFAINQISIIKREDGTLFVSFPSVRTGEKDFNGKDIYQNIIHPITEDMAEELSEHLVDTYWKIQGEEPAEAEFVNEQPLTFSVRIKPYQNLEHLRATATLTFGGSLVVKNVRVMEGKNGLYVQMPSYKTKELDENQKPVYKDYAHPVTAQFRTVLYDAILQEYERSTQRIADLKRPEGEEREEKSPGKVERSEKRQQAKRR